MQPHLNPVFIKLLFVKYSKSIFCENSNSVYFKHYYLIVNFDMFLSSLENNDNQFLQNIYTKLIGQRYGVKVYSIVLFLCK